MYVCCGVLVRAHGGFGEFDAEGVGGIGAQFFQGELVARECVDPAAEAVATLVGEGEQAFRRAFLGGVPYGGHQFGFLHALEGAVDAGGVGLLAAEHGGLRRLLHNDVAVQRRLGAGEQREDGGLRQPVERFSQLSALLQIGVGLGMAAAPHGRFLFLFFTVAHAQADGGTRRRWPAVKYANTIIS